MEEVKMRHIKIQVGQAHSKLRAPGFSPRFKFQWEMGRFGEDQVEKKSEIFIFKLSLR